MSCCSLPSIRSVVLAAWCCSSWADGGKQTTAHGLLEKSPGHGGGLKPAPQTLRNSETCPAAKPSNASYRDCGAGFSARKLFQCAAKGRFGAFALTFILLAPLAFDVMARCESDMLVLLPVAAAFLWLVRGEKKFRAGALLGFAASFKVLPGLFGVYLLCTRQWRALAGMICCGIVCTVLLPLLVWGPQRAWALNLSWYRTVVAPYHSGGAQTFIRDPYRPSNQSLTAGFNRLLRPLPFREDKSSPNVNVFSLSESAVKLLVKGLQALIALGLVLLWSSAGGPDPGAQRRTGGPTGSSWPPSRRASCS